MRWSELTDAEREQAWREYERAFGAREGFHMRFLSDHTFPHGRVETRKDEALIAATPSVEALVLVSPALVVGEELRAHPNTMPHVKRWIIRRCTTEGRAVRLHSNDQIAESHVLVMQPGEVLLYNLAELLYEPGAGDDDTDMHVNPADV